METPSISTEIVSILGGLAVLTPLVKVISQWHITLKKTSPPDASATNLQAQISNLDSQSRSLDKLRLWVMISGLIGGVCGMLMLFD